MAGYSEIMAPQRRKDMSGVPGYVDNFGSFYDEGEKNSTWRDFRERIPHIGEMLHRSGVIQAACDWRTSPLIQSRIEITPGTDRPEKAEEECAEWCQRVFVDAPLALAPADHLRWLVTALEYGFSVTEHNAVADPDGLLTPYRGEFRTQYSISQATQPWEFNDAGELVGINQDPSTSIGKRGPSRMDPRNCIVATYRDTGDPAGNSILRPLERAEFLSHRANVHLGLRIQRVSQPVATFQSAGDYDKDKQALVTQQLRRIWAADGPVVTLFDGDSFSFEGAPDGEGSVIISGIEVFNREIAMALGTPMMVLGQNGGSYSLGLALLDPFKAQLDADGTFIARTYGEYVHRFARKNWGNIPMPRVRLVDTFERSADKLIASLVQAAPVCPEAVEALCRYVADEFGVERVSGPEVGRPESTDEDGASGVTATSAIGEDVQKTALNGAQVTALADVVGRVSAGFITAEQAVAIIVSSFPVSRAAAEAMVGEGKVPSGEPDPTPTRGNDPGEQADPEDQPEDSEADDDDAAPMEATATPYEFALTLKRNPRDCERSVNFATVDGAMTDAVTRIRTATAAIRDDINESLLSQARAVVEAGNIAGVKSIKAPAPLVTKLRKAIRGVLKDVRSEGAASVGRELRRQARRSDEFSAAVLELADPEKPPTAPENTDAIIEDQARQASEEMVRPTEALVQSASREALATGETVKGNPAMREALDRMEAVTIERSENAAKRVGMYSIARAYNLGRAQTAQAAKQETGEEFTAHYSAMLDSNACEFCIAAEMRSINEGGLLVGSPEYWELAPPLGPNSVTQQGCSGGGNCRCIYVYEPGSPRVGSIAGDLS